MRIIQTQVDANNPESVAQQLTDTIRVLNEYVEFGDPQEPENLLSTTRAGSTSTAHNGHVGNIKGSWVDIALTGTGLSVKTCTHNLYLDEAATWTIPVSGEPNCMWTLFGWMHDNTGAASTPELEMDVYFLGGTVALNEIDLTFNIKLTNSLTIDSDHPVVCKMFFTRGTRL